MHERLHSQGNSLSSYDKDFHFTLALLLHYHGKFEN